MNNRRASPPALAAGVIRPRTLGLARRREEALLAQDDKPKPEGGLSVWIAKCTAPGAPLSSMKARVALLLVGLFCVAVLLGLGRSSEVAPSIASPASDAESNNGAFTDDGDHAHDDPDHEDDLEPKGSEEEDDPITVASLPETGGASAASNADEGPAPVAPVQGEQPAAPQALPALAALKTKATSLESYFTNFGGTVVDIDKEGSYKYVLVKMVDSSGKSALLVRGCPHKDTKCKHKDAYAKIKTELDLRGYKSSVVGGGRITRHPSRHISVKAGYISIFGYSKTFGACADCNQNACALVHAAFPDHGVKWSTQGYLESDEKKIGDADWTRC